MSWLPTPDPDADGAVDLVVEPSSKDLGGFSVRRALPSIKRRMVGPFVFLDHMGPALMATGEGLDVRPHPHIGLATLTYLTEGSFVHRDSLGSLQEIRPGEVNWMTAGRGIAHSERTAAATRLAPHRIKRCTYRRLVSLDRARERIYEVECLFPDRKVPVPLGDLDAAMPVCNSCTAAHIFRPDED